MTTPSGTVRPDEAERAGALGRLWTLVGSVVAPATLVTAVLFYFGYVSSRSQYLYFGIDVDLLGFSTQEFVMRSPQPLLVPMLLVLLVGVGLVLVDAALRRRLATAAGATARRWARGLVAAGTALLLLGVTLLLAYPALTGWALFPLVTPVVLGAGAALLAYGLAWARRHPRPGRAAGTGPDPGRTAVVLLVLTVVAALFWATATVAEWSGTTRAKGLASNLTVLPAVVVDTTQRLHGGDPAVEESVLPADASGVERYRYRGLRLLVEGEGVLYLVPQRWSDRGSTFVLDREDVRVRFRFVNDPP
ncbi:hypothetical protein LEP48_12650 [Isoptericola sp. NEAU-Y5]|uniref:DUF5671 domain-containing protein n=1 Tax=Isoptericola luteus TaxID=2879484 RepID=A0ABS7ZGP6_9MICO|nr:hypothetical protein [Isoptericola sp. NEAU-Y5]MCA5894190.1 hypothetical protein [Isoptericola sp. NEAU-Y5]